MEVTGDRGGDRRRFMDAREDREAVAAVLAGDTEAYALLVTRYQHPIFNLMTRMTGSQEDALDLAQETFIKAFERLDTFRSDGRFFPWLYAIGLNHARNFLRRNRLAPVPIDDPWESGEDPDLPGETEARLLARLDTQRVAVALGRIPWEYREALVLHYHQELSMEEVAACLRLSVSGAKMRVHRGLKKLREILAGGEPDPGPTGGKRDTG
jgi:RNA polymerase sigma-70 factor (ECF subfamily)